VHADAKAKWLADVLADSWGGVWTPRVHENLRWYWGARTDYMRVSPSLNYQTREPVAYMCFLSTEKDNLGGRWVGEGKTPALAVRRAVHLLELEAKTLQRVLEAVRDG
jgi:hypothetical protein